MSFYRYYDAWFNIPGFNGYQINPHRREIRSMKMMYKDPGHILKPVSQSKINTLDKTYELTADDARRVRVKYLTLLENTFEKSKDKPQAVDENSTYLGSRQKVFSKHYRVSTQNTSKIDLTKNVVDNRTHPIRFEDKGE